MESCSSGRQTPSVPGLRSHNLAERLQSSTRPARARVVLLLLLASPLLAQDGGIVSGRVVESVTQLGIPRCTVFVSGTFDKRAFERQTSTGTNGEFSVAVPTPSRFRLSASANGFVLSPGDQGYVMELPSGQTTRQITIVLQRRSAIEGQFVDEDDDHSVADVTALARRITFVHGQPNISQAGALIKPEPDGTFRIEGLPAGEYIFEITDVHQGRKELATKDHSGYRRMYWPGLPGYTSSLQLREGAELKIGKVRLRREVLFDATVMVPKPFCAAATKYSIVMREMVGVSLLEHL